MPKPFEHGHELIKLCDIQSAHFNVLALIRSKYREKKSRSRVTMKYEEKGNVRPPTPPVSKLISKAATPGMPDAQAGADLGHAASEHVRNADRRRIVIKTLELAMESRADSLKDMSGGVCHGLTYAWFHSLQARPTTETVEKNLLGLNNFTQREALKATAMTNQATLNYHVIARSQVLPDAEARKRAGQKMAAGMEFDEVEEVQLALTSVSLDNLRYVFGKLVTDKGPANYYRLSIQTPAGGHSLGIVFEQSKLYLLEPNCGVYRYGWGDDTSRSNFINDLHFVLVDTYRTASVKIYNAQPSTKPQEEPGDDLDSLLAQWLNPSP